MRQGVPKCGANNALHRAQAKRGAGHAQLAERSAELWHERHPAAHPVPAEPYHLPAVSHSCSCLCTSPDIVYSQAHDGHGGVKKAAVQKVVLGRGECCVTC